MDCIFCMIKDGKIPSKKIYEDDKVFAILDISRLTYGHTLVIPKEHYEDIYAIPEDLYLHVMTVVKKLAKEITTKLNANGVNIVNNNKEVSGQTVKHFHVHILPRYDKDEFGFKENKTNFDLEEIYNKLK